MTTDNAEIRHLEAGTLNVKIFPDRQSAGAAAARAIAREISKLEDSAETIGIIFAAAASQLDTLGALVEAENIPWSRIRGFHMDEYIGISAEHPASFRHFLRENLTQRVRMKEFLEMDGSAEDSAKACDDYAQELKVAMPQLCLLGIGENGHLAFNDPPEADFKDPLDVKVVHLDDVCRQQQVAEGWFKGLDEVPKTALTLTITALLRVPALVASVPGIRKAKIMRQVLTAPISSDCPATVLRTHPNATVYLDADSASELNNL